VIAHAGGQDESLAIVMVFAGIWTGWIGWSRLRGKGFPRVPVAGAWALVAVAAVLFVASTFVPRALLGPKPPASLAPGTVRPASTATLSITQPTRDARVTTEELTVELDLRGGTIVQATTTNVTPTTGHIHLSLDGSLVSMTYGTDQIVDLSGVGPGPHTLTAEFVAADHLPFSPRVQASVRFVKAAG
jgi:hypothetical protein